MFERVQHGRSDLYYADLNGVIEIASANILNLGDRVYCVSNDTMLYAGFDGLYSEGGKQIPSIPPDVIGISEGGLLRSQIAPAPSGETAKSLFKLIEAGGNGRLWYAMNSGLNALSEYLDFADRVYVIDQGKVLMWTGEDYVEDLSIGYSTVPKTDTATTTVFDDGQPHIPSN